LEALEASLAVQVERQAGPSTGQQRVLLALEALEASQVVLVERRLASEAWAAFLEEQEGQHQASEAWAAFLGVQGVLQ
jgi:hypothetical protein